MPKSAEPSSEVKRPQGLARRLALVVVALSVVAPFSVDTYLPSMPDIAREFGVTNFYLQQTLSFYMIAFGVMTLVYGPLSDSFGRRRVVLISAFVYILTSIGCAFAPNAHALLLMRIGQGLSASGGLVVARAIIRDTFSGAMAQRVMSRVMLMFALAPAIAPIIGGWLHDVSGWRAVFWFMAALGLVVWLSVVFFLPETLAQGDRHPSHPRAIAGAYWRAFRQPRFLGLIAALAFNFSGLFLYIAGSPSILYRDLGFDAQDFGYFFVPVVTGLMVGAFTSGRMAGHYSHERAVSVGYAVMGSAVLINLAASSSLAPTPVTVIGPVAIYACGMSLAMPNLSLLALDYLPRNRGLASALQSFTQTILAAVTAGLLVPALEGHVAWFAVGMLLLCLTGFALWSGSRTSS
jgi:DHA1 family bicyclomycin/chloramphenicol resistance-like MFS transporter